MREELVRIKGVNNGIILFLDDKVSFEKVINDLFTLVIESLPVLSSNKIVIDLGDRKDINPYINKIIEKFKSLSLKLDKIIIRNDSQENYDDIDLFFAPTLKNNRDLTTFLKNTVRSGQQIFAEGDIIVFGDVNPGGEVSAGGNITVLGDLRGVVHAGAKGDVYSYIIAYNLQPLQIRIANYIIRGEELLKKVDKSLLQKVKIIYVDDGEFKITSDFSILREVDNEV